MNSFFYPDLGTGSIYDMISRIVGGGTGNILLNSYPDKIFHHSNRIKQVSVKNDHLEHTFEPGQLINSIPITLFVQKMVPEPPAEIIEAAGNLKFRSLVALFITFDKPNVFKDQWIYFPDKQIPFSRISEPRNFSKKMSPEGKTSLLVEFFCNENDQIWNGS